MIIIVCYIISWTPYWCMQLTYYVYFILEKNQPLILIILSHFSQLIAYMSSALNPFIYSYMSEMFRNDLKAVFASCCSCLREKFPSSRPVSSSHKAQANGTRPIESPVQPAQGPTSLRPVEEESLLAGEKKENKSFNSVDVIEYVDENEPTSDSNDDATLNINPNENNAFTTTNKYPAMELGSFKFQIELLNDNLSAQEHELIKQSLKQYEVTTMNEESEARKVASRREVSPLSTTSTIGPYKFKINFHGFSFNNLLNRPS
jgi:hypothetical protein